MEVFDERVLIKVLIKVFSIKVLLMKALSMKTFSMEAFSFSMEVLIEVLKKALIHDAIEACLCENKGSILQAFLARCCRKLYIMCHSWMYLSC